MTKLSASTCPQPRYSSGTRFADWTPAEDQALRDAYATGARIDLLAQQLGRTEKGAYSRAGKLGLVHPREIKGGFIKTPAWKPEEDALLRDLYGNVPTRDLPARIGRSKTAIFNRAHALGLHHGYHRCWTRPELEALRNAFDRGLAIADLAAALGRKAFSVSKYASNHGMHFGARPLAVEPITLQDILALGDPAVPLPAQVEPRSGRSRQEHDKLIRQARVRERSEKSEAERQQRRAQREAERARRQEVREREKRQRQLAKQREAEARRLQRAFERAAERSRKAEERQLAIELARPASRGITNPDRRRLDVAHKRRSDAVRRRTLERAEAFVDAGKVVTKATPIHIKIAQRAVINTRAEKARLEDPVEQAKLRLQRRGRVVYSAAVIGGPADRFVVSGVGNNLTQDELFAAADRLAPVERAA